MVTANGMKTTPIRTKKESSFVDAHLRVRFRVKKSVQSSAKVLISYREIAFRIALEGEARIRQAVQE